MNEKIRKHVAAYCVKNGWETTDGDIIEVIRDSEEVWSGDEDPRRHWNACFTVTLVDGMLIGFADATTTGDVSPADKGWKFDPSSMCEVQTKEVTTTTYVPVKD